MRLFTSKDRDLIDRLQYERDTAFESAQRLMEANLRFLEETNCLAETNQRLASEVVRLAQRQVPVVPEGEVEQPKSVSENDRATQPEADRRQPARVE